MNTTTTRDVYRTMVLWCPDWPVLATIRSIGIDPDQPVALFDRGLVYACSASARRDGVARGLKLREAQYRCPDLVVFDYDPALDARTFEPVIRGVEEVVPGVQLIRPGSLAIRSRGPSRYYGSEDAAASALLSTMRSVGVLDARIGIADGVFAAEQAARATRDGPVLRVPPGESARFLEPLPVSVLVHSRMATLLNRLGIHRLGEFAALPADDVVRRFGTEGALAHARARAVEHESVIARTPPPEFDQVLELEPGLDRIDQLAFAFRSAAEKFVERLTAATLVCTTLRVELTAEDGALSSRSWLHPHWFTAADVVDRVRWQLQGSGRADSGLSSPIIRVRVHPECIDSTGNHETGLWGSEPDERVHHGLTRVQSMLGHEGVLTAVIGGGRMLSERAVLVPWGDRPPEQHRERKPWPGSLPPPAPATVFRERLPAALLDARGVPLSIDVRGVISAAPETLTTPIAQTPRHVQSWAGPWPVVERWWDPEHGRRVHRFQLVDDDGCAWLLICDRGDWWIEARYD